MRAEKCRFTFRKYYLRQLAIFGCFLGVSCDFGWKEPLAENSVTFAVLDAGQGLAQAVASGGRAVLFDMGPPDRYPEWKTQYETLGRPFIEAIVLSHSHLDHFGGLQELDSIFPWSGTLIVSPYMDTSFIRNISSRWRNRVNFRSVAAYDTLALLEHVHLCCLWPPSDDTRSFNPVDDSLKNRFSMVFLVKKGMSSVLITSDIDSCAMRELCIREGTGLGADVLVVPHHGSSGSLDPVFYGYVRPHTAVISCGAGNPYGHPSTDVLMWLSQMGSTVTITSFSGRFVVKSSGFDWTNSVIIN